MKQLFYQRFPAVRSILEENFSIFLFEEINFKVRGVYSGFLCQRPHIDCCNSQSFKICNGKRIWLVFEKFYMEVYPYVTEEFISDLHNKSHQADGLEVWKHVVNTKIPEYFVEVNYNFDDDAKNRGVEVVVYTIKDISYLKSELKFISDRKTPKTTVENKQKFASKRCSLVTGFNFFSEMECSREETLILREENRRIRITFQ